jgi:hypothetical protein
VSAPEEAPEQQAPGAAQGDAAAGASASSYPGTPSKADVRGSPSSSAVVQKLISHAMHLERELHSVQVRGRRGRWGQTGACRAGGHATYRHCSFCYTCAQMLFSSIDGAPIIAQAGSCPWTATDRCITAPCLPACCPGRYGRDAALNIRHHQRHPAPAHSPGSAPGNTAAGPAQRPHSGQ